MFAFFDDTKFPQIFVTFNSDINDEYWNKFTNTWESYDTRKKHYTFIFDTSGLGIHLFKYSWKMISFIENLKKRKKTHDNVFLSKSIVICNCSYKRFLLDKIFYFQKPVAPVYIIQNKNELKQLYNNISQHPQLYDSKKVSAYFPK